ncbi:hypothetical protein F8M41_000277 [Gigaspora margarita]|uniref:Uncharacterized protein n=1 Tax=Gigaspora margarita TaxID=4874 RepID=A0A8H4AA99_GIGMA|nr:hypothetical protein F8M41_000277 [Gigaspora margarita]
MWTLHYYDNNSIILAIVQLKPHNYIIRSLKFLYEIFPKSTIAQSGVVILPPYYGAWSTCIIDIAAAEYQSFSIKIEDDSAPITPGFGYYVAGNSSEKRIHGVGFRVNSLVKSSITENSTTGFNNIQSYNYIFYCGSNAVVVTQCDSPFMGLPLPNQTNQEWCLYIANPFNNSQKAYLSFIPDKTSINATYIDKSVNGITKNIINDHLLLILLILLQMLWEYFC